MILAIDPGPTTCGFVIYDPHTQRVSSAHAELSWPDVRRRLADHLLTSALVVCERIQAGPPSSDVVLTTEVVGRVIEWCDSTRMPLELLYRRDALAALGISAKGPKDPLVRAALIELHGGTKQQAVGNRFNRGPLYGVSSHAWAALALAVTSNLRNGAKYAQQCP